ncbi:MAG: cupin domain-containing protein [Bacteroidales bacterium]|nr:cupin domain-containing protein [Bacteroidales bacterium]
MHIILLSGGSGKRLWPLSNEVRSKQFIPIFKRGDGSYESMVQRVFRQIRATEPEATVTIATSKSQVSSIHNQLGDAVGISVEPCRRDTFPAIALASAYLHDIQGVGLDEAVVVCPVDPYVEDDYFVALKRLSELAQHGTSNLTLLGIEPSYPSSKFGYIIPCEKGAVSRVETFKEKPTEEVAAEYIKQGALWNGGVFAYRLGYVLNRAEELIGFSDYQQLFSRFGELKKISFDYAVVEHERDIAVMRFSGVWQDLGTWNTLTEGMTEPVMGKGILGEGCENVHVLNELNVPVLCMGLKDVIVAASPDGILVTDRESSARIKPYVDGIEQQLMFADKSWGRYHVLDVQPEGMTVKVTLKAGAQMNYHSHEHRNEVWTVVSGEGETLIDGMTQRVGPGDVITILSGCKHRVKALTELTMIEVQLGKDITVHDKKKYTE